MSSVSGFLSDLYERLTSNHRIQNAVAFTPAKHNHVCHKSIPVPWAQHDSKTYKTLHRSFLIQDAKQNDLFTVHLADMIVQCTDFDKDSGKLTAAGKARVYKILGSVGASASTDTDEDTEDLSLFRAFSAVPDMLTSVTAKILNLSKNKWKPLSYDKETKKTTKKPITVAAVHQWLKQQDIDRNILLFLAQNDIEVPFSFHLIEDEKTNNITQVWLEEYEWNGD